MSLEQWASGEQIAKTKLNAEVDQINSNASAISTLQTDVAGKAAVCSDAGQDVADAGAAGSAVTAARCDHKHKGVSKLKAGTNITLEPTSGVGEVTVNATAGAAILSKTITIPAGTYPQGANTVGSWAHMPTAILGTAATITGHSGGADVSTVNPYLESTPSGHVTMILGTVTFATGADQTGAYPIPRLDRSSGHIGDTGFNLVLYVYYASLVVTSGSVTIYYVD